MSEPIKLQNSEKIKEILKKARQANGSAPRKPMTKEEFEAFMNRLRERQAKLAAQKEAEKAEKTE